jgi:hypothetical protein
MLIMVMTMLLNHDELSRDDGCPGSSSLVAEGGARERVTRTVGRRNLRSSSWSRSNTKNVPLIEVVKVTSSTIKGTEPKKLL